VTDQRTGDLFAAKPLGKDEQSKAEKRRDIGIERSGAHADLKNVGMWRVYAAGMIRDFGREYGKAFLIEDVLPYARNLNLPDPPDGRAWGAATQLAKRNGFIRSCGARRAKSSNMSPKVLWIAI
jgi:hypothetical protein